MKTTFLDFEQSIADLESKIEELRFVQDDSAVDIAEEIGRLEKKSAQLTKDVYAKLTPWRISQAGSAADAFSACVALTLSSARFRSRRISCFAWGSDN